LKKTKLAVNSALKSVEFNPQDVGNFIQLAKCYLTLHEWKNTQKAMDYALTLPLPKNVDLMVNLAKILFDIGDTDQSLALYNQALNLSPKHPPALHNRALLHRFMGNFSDSEKDYEALLNINPDDYEAYYELSQLKTWHGSNNPWLTALNKVATNNLPWKHQAYIEFAKAKFLEDQQQFNKAFVHYSTGNNLVYDNSVHDNIENAEEKLNQDLRILNTLPGLFLQQQLTQNNDYTNHPNQSLDSQPLFIVGMPRTGSTLIERILSSHSKINSGGELTSMPLAIMESVGLTALHDPFSLNLDHLEPPLNENAQTIKDRYLQLTHDKICNDRIGSKEKPSFIIDKLPFNDRFIGHIVSAFPNAKIIYTERNFMDTVMSNYRMLFNHGYFYSYDLKQLMAYAQSHQQMMTEWKKNFPNNLYKLQYESLIEQPTKTITELLNFCGLTLENSCLEFHKNSAISQTASASQIRQSLHNRSINSWKHYQPFLEQYPEEFIQQ
jgi:tetratricopeptide (TPR) repeat protein